MDKIDAMRLFTRIVDRRSFVAAAADLSIPRSTATEAIKQLEARLGVRLLQRSTRHVTPTIDGEAFYERCGPILDQLDEVESSFSTPQAKGLLRVDLHGAMARRLLLPHLPTFLKRHPDLKLYFGEGDRLVDLVREGVDVVVRAGVPLDSGMIVRRLGSFREATAASPDYIARHGMPTTPDDLEGHEMVAFMSSRTRNVLPLEFTYHGEIREIVLPSRITVSGGDTSVALAQLGFGIMQAPRHRLDEEFAKGTLVEILADYPPTTTPVSALYPHSRHLSPRVRVFVDWLISIFPQDEAYRP